MKLVSTSELQANVEIYLKARAKEPVLVTSKGKPVALLDGSLDEDDWERLRLAYNPKFRRMVAAAMRRFREGKGIPHDEFWRRMEQKHPEAFTKKPVRSRKREAKKAS